MIHRILTCKHHPKLRWTTKEIAWNGHYNGCRNIFFDGTPSGKGLYSDFSGLDCTPVKNGEYFKECKCPARDLILAPEDAIIMEVAFLRRLGMARKRKEIRRR